MGEFFKGWRCKAGLVTLAMALLLTVAWTRSYVTADAIKFGFIGQQHIAISLDGQLAWESYPGYGRLQYERRQHRVTGNVSVRAVIDQMSCKAPYWSVVLPLTLLSAWLILVKPRKAKTATGSTR